MMGTTSLCAYKICPPIFVMPSTPFHTTVSRGFESFCTHCRGTMKNGPRGEKLPAQPWISELNCTTTATTAFYFFRLSCGASTVSDASAKFPLASVAVIKIV